MIINLRFCFALAGHRTPICPESHKSHPRDDHNMGSMGRDSKDAAIFVAGAAVGAAALFLLTKTSQSSKVATENGKTRSGNDDTSEVAAARAEVRAIFDERTAACFWNSGTPATT